MKRVRRIELDPDLVARRHSILGSFPKLNRSAPYPRKFLYYWQSVATGKNASLNGDGVPITNTMPRVPGVIPTILRAWVVWGTTSSSDDGSNYTQVEIYDGPQGAPKTGTVIADLRTTSGPAAAVPIQLGLWHVLDPSRILWAEVTRVGTGSNHDNDSYAFGLDMAAFRIGPEEFIT